MLADDSEKAPAANPQVIKTQTSELIPLFADATPAKAKETKTKEAKPAKEELKPKPSGIRLEVPACLSLESCGCCLLAPLSLLGF